MKLFTKVLMLIILAGGLTSSAHADRKSREEEKARLERLESQKQQVESILRQETAGGVTDRKVALKEVLARGEAPDEAYWQAGYIKQGDKWVSVEDRWLTPEQEQELGEYTKARDNYANSDEGQYKLALWCAEQRFDQQASAHLKAVLMNNPDHAGLRQLLGYQKIGNRWLNQEEYKAILRESDRLATDLQQWGPVVLEIRDGLHSPKRGLQEKAKEKLKEITEVAAVPALELILMPSSDLGAAACVEQLCEIDQSRASIALCKAAILLPGSAVIAKQAAIEELKTRPLEDFFPVLLEKMQTPMTIRYWFYQRLSGGYDHGPFNLPTPYFNWQNYMNVGFSIQNENQHEVRDYTRFLIMRDLGYHGGMQDRNGYYALAPSAAMSEKYPLTLNNLRLRGEMMMKSPAQLIRENREDYLNSIDKLLQINQEIRRQNTANVELNNLITELMGDLTSESRYESPEFWWRWWARRIEVESDQKLKRNVIEVDEQEILHFNCSCFVAGTPISTDCGARPIEELRIGDMALTQDVETGELAYRPIIRTTTRKPKPLVTVNLGAEQITSTGGHPFFVSGEGWVRARELRAGQILHTPTGSLPIVSVNETPEQETYNLVVDGFHTYFVGMSQVLVHDVSVTSPTDAVVPGLLDR